MLALGWRLAALAGLVYVSRNAVLRAREVYADVRASVPDGPRGALRRVLAGLPARHASTLARLRSVHPDPRVRLAAVDDTRRLFPLGLLVTFGAGIAATIAYESLVTCIGIFADDPLTIRLLAAVAFAPLAMGVVGVGVWRGAWGALAEGGTPPPTWPLALALVAGFLVGPVLALERAVRIEGDDTLLESALGSGAPWIAALVTGVVLLLAWVAAGAAGWIRSLAGAASPSRAAAAGLVVSSGLLAALVGVFYTARDSRQAIGFSRNLSELEHAQIADVAWIGPAWLWQLTQDGQLLVVIAQPAVFVALVALWLFPLAAWMRRRTPVADAPWAFLDRGGRLTVPPLGDRLPLTPVLVGIAAGAAFVVAVLVLRVGVRNGVDADTRGELWFPVAFFFWQFLLALVAQAAAGTIAAARAREAPLIASLGAAFVAGIIAAAVIAFGPSAAGCVDPIAINPGPCEWTAGASFTWLLFRQVVIEGALVALAAGLVVVGVQALLRRRMHAEPPVPVDAAGPI